MTGQITAEHGALDRYFNESHAYINSDPIIFTRLYGWMTQRVGAFLSERIPTSVIRRLERLAGDIVLPSRSDVVCSDAYDPARVTDVLQRADQVHRQNLYWLFGEGAVASGSIAAAGAGGPLASSAVALAEMPTNYLLTLRRSIEIQRAFQLVPTIERADRAFSIATATSREHRLQSYSLTHKTMLEGTIARRLTIHKSPELVAKVKRSAVSAVSDLARQLAADKATDSAAEQSARLMLISSFKAFCQRHPQLMCIALPIGGALAGGAWSAWSARGLMLSSYHISRLEYIEHVRQRIRAHTEVLVIS